MAVIPAGWTEPGVIIASAGMLAGFGLWARKHVVNIWGWVRQKERFASQDSRISALEKTVATKDDLKALSDGIRASHDEHVLSDAKNFERVNDLIRHIEETMPRREDLVRVETNLTAVMMEGFRKTASGS